MMMIMIMIMMMIMMKMIIINDEDNDDDNDNDNDNNYSVTTFTEGAQLAMAVFSGAIMQAKESDRRPSFFRARHGEQK